MSLNWYQCKKCETLIKQDSSPKNAGCPEGSYHEWSNLGEFGEKNYLCKKCSASVQVNTTPKSAGCPEGSYHDWKKL